MKNKLLGVAILFVVFSFMACGYANYVEYEPIQVNQEMHPFSVALEKHIADYDGNIRAFFTTLDDDGKIGILATKAPEWVLFDYDMQEYKYTSIATLFFIQDDNLIQLDASGLFVSGRYNRLMSRIYSHTSIIEFIHTIENGELEVLTRLEYFEDSYLQYLFGNEAAKELIERRNALREQYGLSLHPVSNPWLMENIHDQTEQILSMTIDCIPRLE